MFRANTSPECDLPDTLRTDHPSATHCQERSRIYSRARQRATAAPAASCRLSFQTWHAITEADECCVSLPRFPDSGGRRSEVGACLAPALNQRLPEARGHESLPFQALQRRIDAGQRHLSATARGDIPRNRHTVRVSRRGPCDGQQHHQLELTEILTLSHNFHIIEVMGGQQVLHCQKGSGPAAVVAGKAEAV